MFLNVKLFYSETGVQDSGEDDHRGRVTFYRVNSRVILQDHVLVVFELL